MAPKLRAKLHASFAVSIFNHPSFQNVCVEYGKARNRREINLLVLFYSFATPPASLQTTPWVRARGPSPSGFL